MAPAEVHPVQPRDDTQNEGSRPVSLIDLNDPVVVSLREEFTASMEEAERLCDTFEEAIGRFRTELLLMLDESLKCRDRTREPDDSMLVDILSDIDRRYDNECTALDTAALNNLDSCFKASLNKARDLKDEMDKKAFISSARELEYSRRALESRERIHNALKPRNQTEAGSSAFATSGNSNTVDKTSSSTAGQQQ